MSYLPNLTESFGCAILFFVKKNIFVLFTEILKPILRAIMRKLVKCQ